MAVRIYASPVTSFAALGKAWRRLEAKAAELSFFQSWTWVGCLAEERYPDPVLLQAEEGGHIVAMALFNRRRGRICLTESGEARLDAPFIEHNAPLLAAGANPETLHRLFEAAWRLPGTRRLVLSGVTPDLLRVAGGTVLRRQERPSPFVDLDAVRAAGGDYLATLSANTRYQIRRSVRRYVERGGLSLRQATTEAEALAWLDALMVLHSRWWSRRGLPGAFTDPFIVRFHRALVAQAMACGEVELLRIDAGDQVIGYLYNFRLGRHVHAYQSGFDLEGAGLHEKPGLTCHALAVQRALKMGERVYDFLAGEARYKRNLANAALPLVWAELVPSRSMPGIAVRLRDMVWGRPC